jgi:hypothetical protein
MPRTQYKTIHSTNVDALEKDLAGATVKGWKPILMTSSATSINTFVIVVILEHTVGS